MRHRTPFSRLAAVATLVAIAACSAEPARDDPARAGRADTAAATPAAAAAPWTVTDHAVGPLRIGMTFADAGAALGAALPTSGDGGECRRVGVPGAPAGLSLMFVRDTLVRFDVVDTLPRTRGGVGVGSDEVGILATYGSRASVGPHKYDAPPAHYLTVASSTDSSHATVFETDGRRVTRYRAGRRPEVEWVEGCL